MESPRTICWGAASSGAELRSALPEKGWAAGGWPRGCLLPQGACPARMHPPFLFCLAKRETGRARSKEKSVRRAPVQWPSARDGGRRIGASADLGPPSGTLFSSAKSALPSRGGWCVLGRGARTHLTSSSFRAFRFATRCPGECRSCCVSSMLQLSSTTGQRQRKSAQIVS